MNKKLLTGMEEWRLRDLHGVEIKYIYVDGVFFEMRVGDSVEKVAILVVIGVKENDEKMFLAIQQGDKESAATWREVFKDLKGRGLDHSCVRLGIMDGLTGLERVFREEFPYAKIQRCLVHVTRNVIAKVPYKMKTKIGDYLRDIFYASGKEKALENYNRFVSEYEQLIPSAVKSLHSSIESCLAFFSFPRQEWTSLRTTNVIERVNKEFKRRTRPMEIVAGEAAAYRLLCFIALKMEGYWSHNAEIKRKYSSAIPEFTQDT